MMEKTRIIIIIGFQERLENKHYINVRYRT